MKLNDRSSERNTLRADLMAGRLMTQAVHQARLAYKFSPNAYSYECLSAVLRLQTELENYVHDMAKSSRDYQNSPQSEDMTHANDQT
jgi:hypothetical protein